jgi:hypothetical protein
LDTKKLHDEFDNMLKRSFLEGHKAGYESGRSHGEKTDAEEVFKKYSNFERRIAELERQMSMLVGRVTFDPAAKS